MLRKPKIDLNLVRFVGGWSQRIEFVECDAISKGDGSAT